jgi:hypothetical protein
LFDRDGYAFENLPFHFAEGGSARIPGPKSDRIKYAPLICNRCNNQRTAAHDRAYDLISNWFSVSQQDGGAPELDVSEVFGDDWPDGIEQFRKFCAKCLGCRILAADCSLPSYFPNPVSGKNMEMLVISICRTQPFRSVPNFEEGMGDEILGKGDLLANISKSHLQQTGERKIISAIWWENVGNFQINHWFAIRPHPRLGQALDGSQIRYHVLSNDFDLQTMKEEMFAWLSAGELPYAGADRYTRPLATVAWSVYLATRASDAPYDTADLMNRLLETIERTKPTIDAEVRSYRTHGNLDAVMSFFMDHVTALIKVACRALGCIDRQAGPQPELASHILKTEKSAYFVSACGVLHAALVAMFERHSSTQRQAAVEDGDDLTKAIWDLCTALGFVLQIQTTHDGHCYVQIPFRPDNSPP